MNRRSLEVCCVLARLVAGGPLCHLYITGHSFALMEGGGGGGGGGGRESVISVSMPWCETDHYKIHHYWLLWLPL